jgi:hypothetical protein
MDRTAGTLTELVHLYPPPKEYAGNNTKSQQENHLS